MVSVPSAGRNGLELDDGHLAANPRQRGFSTLCGSKWIGTGRQPEHGHIHYTVFQYPLRVEMDWNRGHRHRAVLHAVVSVPSAGRNGLEPAGRRGTGRRAEVSVPSAGRNGLEPEPPKLPDVIELMFQYPLRVEMDWNYRTAR